ncbi:MAG: disulfide bond formation protein B [Saezia sp.]
MIFAWFERYPAFLFLLMALTVFGLVGAGVYLQWSDPVFVVPCHMCVFQRYLYIIIGVFALISAFFAAYSVKTIRFFSFIIFVISATGVYVSGVQSWMQRFPSDDAACRIGGDDIYTFVVENSPFTEMLPILFRADGNCNDPGWIFLNLSIANWSFIAFSCCVIAMILMFFLGGKGERSPFD